MNRNAMLMPAIWGGVVIGVLSALPVVSIGNLCCCLWVISGGLVASYLLQSNTPDPITSGDGALVGLLSGLAGAVIYAVVSLPMSLLLGPVQQRVMRQVLESAQDVPDQVRQAFENWGGSAAFSIIGVIFGFVMMLVVGAIFATLGGLLGAVFFKKQPAADIA